MVNLIHHISFWKFCIQSISTLLCIRIYISGGCIIFLVVLYYHSDLHNQERNTCLLEKCNNFSQILTKSCLYWHILKAWKIKFVNLNWPDCTTQLALIWKYDIVYRYWYCWWYSGRSSFLLLTVLFLLLTSVLMMLMLIVLMFMMMLMWTNICLPGGLWWRWKW